MSTNGAGIHSMGRTIDCAMCKLTYWIIQSNIKILVSLMVTCEKNDHLSHLRVVLYV